MAYMKDEIDRRLDRIITEDLLDEFVAVSGPNVMGTGDSLTAGALGGGTTWPLTLQSIITSAYTAPGTVYNMGVGGETPATIAGRTMHGVPWMATVAGGSIPASGGVVVTLLAADGETVAPLLQGSAGINPVIIEGVSGTLSYASSVYTFTRTTAGSAVPCPSPVEVSTAAQRDRANDLTVMWWGQNGTQEVEALITRQRASIRLMKALKKRWIVVGLSTGTSSSRAAMDARLLAEYGDRFINIRTYLSSTDALMREGIVATTDDLAKIAVGSVPSSFLGNPGGGDFTHLNAAGYRRVGRAIYEKIKALGWNDQWGTLGDDDDEPIAVTVDTFERTSASINGETPTVGAGTWLVIGGSSVAYIDSGALAFNRNGSGESIARLIAPGTNARMKATLRTRGGGAAYMRLRYADTSNYLRFYCLADGLWLFGSIVAGTSTTHASGIGSAADGDVIDITLNGTAATILINGAQVWTGTIPVFGSSPAAYGFSVNSLADASRWERVDFYTVP